MSMYTLLRNNCMPTIDEVDNYLQGNLCRCTGYRPILSGKAIFLMLLKLVMFHFHLAFETFTKEADGECDIGRSCCRNKNGNRPNGNADMANGCCGVVNDENLKISKSQFLPYDPSQEPIFPPELLVRIFSNHQHFFKPINLHFYIR